jgi:hypothetical protein
MKIIKVDLSDHYRMQQFLDLPFRIYQGIHRWVPPLETDTRLIFDQQKNPFYKHSTASFFLALTDDGSPIGRLAFLNNQNYNAYNQTEEAFFCLFECFSDQDAARELFNSGFEWARKQGLKSMVGPKGFNALDGLGLLVKGFEHRPAFGITYNPAYYPSLVENAGFKAHSDIVSGYLSAQTSFPEKIHEVSRVVQQRRGLKIINFRNKRELRRIVPKFKDMYNKMVQGTIGNVPLTDDEVDTLANQLIGFADPRLIKIIEKDDRFVGYLIAYPDISAAIQATHGQIYPFGWLQLLREMRRTNWVNINGAGIIEQYQGLGGTAILFSEMYKSIIDGGFEHAELVQIGVDNDKMQREMRELGVDFYKTHRIYQRTL